MSTRLDLRVGSKVYRRSVTASLRISQLAERSGYRPSALRYYEQVGLLPATERTPAGYRLYDDTALDRLRFIDRAKQLGLALPEIRELVAIWDGGACAHVQDRLRGHVATKTAEVRDRIAELERFAGQLAAAADQLSQQAPDGPCEPGCGCAGPTDTTPVLGPELVPFLRHRPGPDPDGPTGQPQVPVACTLTGPDQAGRLADWQDLLRNVTDRQHIDGGLRLYFLPDPQLAGRLGVLAAKEQDCCSFFTFALLPTTGALLFDVTAPPDAAGVVADLFGGAA